MKRRAFIAGLATLPFIGKAVAKPVSERLFITDIELNNGRMKRSGAWVFVNYKYNADMLRHEFKMRWLEQPKPFAPLSWRGLSWHAYTEDTPNDVRMYGRILRVGVHEGRPYTKWVRHV